MGLLDRFKQIASGNRCDINQRFEVLREAISGTMSKCFKARDRRNDRIVAVKVLDKQKTAELEGLVAHAGLRMVERYGDFGWRSLDATAESQVLVCEHAIPRRGNAVSRRGFRRG